MAVFVQPDVRIGVAVTGELISDRVGLLTFSCCGAQLNVDESLAPEFASLLDRIHRCAPGL